MKKLVIASVSLGLVAGFAFLVSDAGAGGNGGDRFGLGRVVGAPGAPSKWADHPERLGFDANAALEDGAVTPGEYYSANAAVVECLRSAGATVTDPTLSKNERHLGFTYSVPSELEDSIQSAYAKCHMKYADPVIRAWVRQTTPSDSEQRSVEDAIKACESERSVAAKRTDVAVDDCSGDSDLLVHVR